MSVEGGTSGGGSGGGGVGGVGGGVGAGVSVGGFGRVGEFRGVGPSMFGPEVTGLSQPFIAEGPVGRSFLENSVTLAIGQLNPVSEIKFNDSVQSGGVSAEELSAQVAIAEAGKIIAQAQITLSEEEVLAEANHWLGIKESNSVVEIKQPEYGLPSWQLIIPQTEPRVVPIAVPNKLEYPRSQPVVSPALELKPTTTFETKTKTENQVSAAVAPTILTESVLDKQEVEKVITERVTVEQIDTVKEEETEESKLKDVVDGEVLNIRVEEFGSAADKAGAEVEKVDLEEIDGKRITELIPAETVVNRSGLIKKQGPDGSRVETIEEVASKKFSTVSQAKEQIMAIIAWKVPVKKAKEGITVGYEAVIRVLKYFFVKAKPTEQLVTRVIKKQKVLIKKEQQPLQIVPTAKPEIKELRIEDLNLAEVFQKAA